MKFKVLLAALPVIALTAFLFPRQKAARSYPTESRRIYGGIIPHHLLAERMIIDFFGRVKDQEPKLVILIGPNHQELGDAKILTSTEPWETKEGVLPPDFSIIGTLIEKGIMSNEPEIVKNDHSMYEIVPFITKYLPGSEVVPLLMSGYQNADEVEAFSKELSKFIDKDTLVIVSTDFSHYLSAGQAKQNDQITYQYIANFDTEKIMTLGSDYLDSPPSVVLLLCLMEVTGHQSVVKYLHSNSAELTNNLFAITTSYFTIGFY
jgi:AmmeMemoRadiSam system protein B